MLTGDGWESTEDGGIRRKWTVRGTAASVDISKPDGGAITVRLQVAGADLWFDVEAGEEVERAIAVVTDVPAELRPASAGEWLERIRAEFPVRFETDPGDLLTDDPFAHPVDLPYIEDNTNWHDEPVYGRIRRVLTRAGWYRSGSGAMVMGLALDFRCKGARSCIDVGFVNLEVWIDLDSGGGRTRLRAACADVADADRLLRLLLAWESRIDERRIELFPAELAATLPGSAVKRGARWHRLPVMRALPAELAGAGAQARAAAMVATLGAAGWSPAVVEPVGTEVGTVVTTLAAMEKPGGRVVRCEYVLTGAAELSEALRIVVPDPEPGRNGLPYLSTGPDERLMEHLGDPIDVYVDVLATCVQQPFTPRETTARRLDAALARLVAGGPTAGVLSGLGLTGGLLRMTGDGPEERLVSAATAGFPTEDARPLAEIAADLSIGDNAGIYDLDPGDPEVWLEAGFAALREHWWPAALAAFERAADGDEALADLWVGGLLFHSEPGRAREALRRAAENGCVPATARRVESHLLHLEGEHDAAVEALRAGTLEVPDDADHWASYGLDLAKHGRPADAVAALDEAITRSDAAGNRWYRAYAHHLAGNRDAALTDLEAAAARDAGLIDQIHADPDFAGLRGEPRFEGIVENRDRNRDEVQQRLEEALGWADLSKEDDDTGQSIQVRPVGNDGSVTVVHDCEYAVYFTVGLGGDPGPLVEVLRGWPGEYGDDDGYLEEDRFADALAKAYPGKVSRSY